MQDDPFRDRLRRLEERIEAARGERDGASRRRRSHAGASELGWRMVTELVTGMALGLAIGYGLDGLFGTLPLFLVVFALLGFAAGVRTMLRSAREFQARERPAPPPGAGEDRPRDAGPGGRNGGTPGATGDRD